MSNVAWGIVAVALLVGASCAGPTPPQERSGTAHGAAAAPAIAKSWSFRSAPASAETPVTLTLRLEGTDREATYKWWIDVRDGGNASLFSLDGDSLDLDGIFRESYASLDCPTYVACKEQWYFDEWPEFLSRASSIVDNTGDAVGSADYRRQALKDEAREFLQRRGLSPKQQSSVINEMLGLLAGRFDCLYLPLGPFAEGLSLMYVPSVGYFVPFWHA